MAEKPPQDDEEVILEFFNAVHNKFNEAVSSFKEGLFIRAYHSDPTWQLFMQN